MDDDEEADLSQPNCTYFLILTICLLVVSSNHSLFFKILHPKIILCLCIGKKMEYNQRATEEAWLPSLAISKLRSLLQHYLRTYQTKRMQRKQDDRQVNVNISGRKSTCRKPSSWISCSIIFAAYGSFAWECINLVPPEIIAALTYLSLLRTEWLQLMVEILQDLQKMQ